MKTSDQTQGIRKAKQRIIAEMIDASMERSLKLGKHPAATRRKRLLRGPDHKL